MDVSDFLTKIQVEVHATKEKGFMMLITVPGRLGQKMGWDNQTELQVLPVDEKAILIREISPRCALCHQRRKNMTQVEKSHICTQCLAKAK